MVYVYVDVNGKIVMGPIVSQVSPSIVLSRSLTEVNLEENSEVVRKPMMYKYDFGNSTFTEIIPDYFENSSRDRIIGECVKVICDSVREVIPTFKSNEEILEEVNSRIKQLQAGE